MSLRIRSKTRVLGGPHTREVQIPDRELGAFNMHGKIHFTSPRQILDVAVPTVFGTAGDRPCAFLADFGFSVLVGGACVHVFWLGRLGDDALEGGGGDEFGFALVPFGKNFGGWGTAEDAGVDEAGEADAGDVARGAEDAFKVPDCFGAVGFCEGRHLVRMEKACGQGEGPRLTLRGRFRRGSLRRCPLRRRP